MSDFVGFPKIARLNRNCVITEKIDGTNAQIVIDGTDPKWVRAGSRNRWITPEDDNHGFARWVQDNRVELLKLGDGRHFGEWWGQGIQRGYGLTEKRFSLFNVARWWDPAVRPHCCGVVPVLYEGPFSTAEVERVVLDLRRHGSYAAPFMKPEGLIVWHEAGRTMFKVTLDKDEQHKNEHAA